MKLYKDQIEKLSGFFENISGIRALILYGSTGRDEETLNSDLDLFVWLFPEADPKQLFHETKNFLRNEFSEYIKGLQLEEKNKMLFFFNQSPFKIELLYHSNLEHLRKYYSASHIPEDKIPATILCDKTASALPVIKNWVKNNPYEHVKENGRVDKIAERFAAEFANASFRHAVSDSYQFYFFSNIAFSKLIELAAIAFGQEKKFFFPPYFFQNILPKQSDWEELFKQAKPEIDLSLSNRIKENQIILFERILTELNRKDLILQFGPFLRSIYERDFLWNFRDFAAYHPGLRKGMVYRSATLSIYPEKYIPKLKKILDRHGINTIIDLRSNEELKEFPYHPELLKDLNYNHIPLDPKKDQAWYEQEYVKKYISGKKKAYRYFITEFCSEIKQIFEIIARSKEAVLIHCFAGKDRTGMLMMLLGMLNGLEYEVLLHDYLKSGMDTTKEDFDIYYQSVMERGSIEEYLKSCGLSENTLQAIRKKFKDNSTSL